MYIIGDDFDSVYTQVCKYITENGNISSPRGLHTHEILGAFVRINNPRTRMLQNKKRNISIPFAIAEWLWCIKGSNNLKMLEYYAPSYGKYSDDGETLYGAYGPRFIGELPKVISLLKRDPDTRRALIPIYSHRDVAVNSKDIPCTCGIQFLIRDQQLHAMVHMRSNDVYLGLPYDVFNFSMMQEYVASMLGVSIGTYTHLVNSLHVYDKHIQIVAEIGHSKPEYIYEMPAMPFMQQEEQIEMLIYYESNLRRGKEINLSQFNDYFKILAQHLKDYGDKKSVKEDVVYAN
ncbi:thymidylate synthase [Brevibacillus panacihumi W25]|uniref:thymidylate synthase n=1 Tax=Brevibacillus panacihumi W25 TaxID=1408254 RepID=V6M0Z7_9BACL|nr:thymidylate synthase [Brevibacillus panacihumi]EST51575.1 thymidylate synthase [Brevibacillus panacihumi W25]